MREGFEHRDSSLSRSSEIKFDIEEANFEARPAAERDEVFFDREGKRERERKEIGKLSKFQA